MSLFMKDVEQANTLIGHNVAFDINVLCSELYRRKKARWLSMLLLKHTRDTACESVPRLQLLNYPSLTDLYFMLFHKHPEGAHRAGADALHCAEVFQEMTKYEYKKKDVQCVAHQEFNQGIYPQLKVKRQKLNEMICIDINVILNEKGDAKRFALRIDPLSD